MGVRWKGDLAFWSPSSSCFFLQLPKSEGDCRQCRPVRFTQRIVAGLEVIECWKYVFIPNLADISSFPQVLKLCQDFQGCHYYASGLDALELSHSSLTATAIRVNGTPCIRLAMTLFSCDIVRSPHASLMSYWTQSRTGSRSVKVHASSVCCCRVRREALGD